MEGSLGILAKAKTRESSTQQRGLASAIGEVPVALTAGTLTIRIVFLLFIFVRLGGKKKHQFQSLKATNVAGQNFGELLLNIKSIAQKKSTRPDQILHSQKKA